MALVTLPRDVNAAPVQALAPTGLHAKAAIGASSAGDELPDGAEIIHIAATGNCYLKFGFGSLPTATATDMLFPVGATTFHVPNGATHFAVIQEGSSTGVLGITKLV